jgi:hypothetical protein
LKCGVKAVAVVELVVVVGVIVEEVVVIMRIKYGQILLVL